LNVPADQSAKPKSKLRWYQFSLGSLFIVTVVVAVISSWFAIDLRHQEEERRRIETPIEQSEWPKTFLTFCDDAEKSGIEVENTKVYCISCVEYYWRLNASTKLRAFMVARWKLIPVNSNDGILRLFWRDIPTNLSSSLQGGTVEYFRTAEWEGGDLFILLNDTTHQQVVVRYYYRF
jgi:hypothetical protein